jgi:hypothetical protein
MTTRTWVALSLVGGLMIATALVVRNQVEVASPRADRPEEASPLDDATRARRQALVAELQPVTLSNCELARVGGSDDGGYVMCRNLLDGITTAYSYGIGGSDDWGCEISATYKVPVHQYDCFNPTVLQCAGGHFKLNSECVGPRTEVIDGRPFDTIANHIARNRDRGKRMAVKMDIEGGEWLSLLATPDEVFDSIVQMPMELHGVDEPEVLEGVLKLKRHFYVLSVHFNNYACDASLAPMAGSAYQVLLVNKRVGKLGAPPPGRPGAERFMEPDWPGHPECPPTTPTGAAGRF